MTETLRDTTTTLMRHFFLDRNLLIIKHLLLSETLETLLCYKLILYSNIYRNRAIVYGYTPIVAYIERKSFTAWRYLSKVVSQVSQVSHLG